MPAPPSVIDIQVANKLFASVAEEMGIVLARAAFSANIKERRDFSCAVFDGRGQLVAQASHIPVHLGAMPATLAHVLATLPPGPDEVVVTNDPFGGGSHLPDITLVRGVFPPGADTPLFYVVNRAHHADVGGRSPGSMGLCRTIDEEGVRIPPTLLVAKGETNQAFLNNFLGQVRTPAERLGDLRAQQAALARGEKRLLELARRLGDPTPLVTGLLDYGERLMRAAIRAIPDGTYGFTDFLDDDGRSAQPVPISVECTVTGDMAVVDFSRSADQVASPLNAVRPVTVSAVMYVFQCLLGLAARGPGTAGDYPINGGSQRPITVRTRPGSIVDAAPPAAVAAGNVETSQRIVDALLGALAQAIPERIPAASCGSMNNIAIGGRTDDGAEFTYYETIGGGMGGRPNGPGLSGVHTHMTNTMNTPVEALEHAFPFQITHYRLRRNSGGQGLHPGGDGIVRGYRFLCPATVSLLTERRRTAPYGLAGGAAGRPGKNILVRNSSHSGQTRRLPGKTTVEVNRGDRLVLHTPGGGGWGAPDR